MEVNNGQAGRNDPAQRRTQVEPGVTGANRPRSRGAQVNAQPSSEVDTKRPVGSESLPEVDHARRSRLPIGDVLQLAHAHEPEEFSPAREARLRALTEAFRAGNLNSPERIFRAAEKMLQG